MAENEAQDRYGAEPVPPPVQPTVAPPPVVVAPPVDLANADVLCKGCGFNLRGLTPQHKCPECAFPVWRTLQGEPLVYSSAEYLQALLRGVNWVLIGYLAQIVIGLASLGFVVLVIAWTIARAQPPPPWIEEWASLIGVPAYGALLYGWWTFSTPDPGIVAGNKGDTPRVILRWTSVIALFAAILAGVISVLGREFLGVQIGQVAISLISGLAGIAQFFASLLYVRWMARRMQDMKLVNQTTLYLWLLPLIYIVGACVVIGPIVAFIMYVVMLYRVRTALQTIMHRQHVELPALDVPDRR